MTINYKEILNAMEELRITMKKFKTKNKTPFQKIEFQAMLFIEEAENITMQQLGKELGVTKPRVTAIITDLGEKGYIEQITDKTDKRKKLLKLSRVGSEYMNIHREQYEYWFKNLVEQFTTEEQEMWKNITKKVNTLLNKQLEQCKEEK